MAKKVLIINGSNNEIMLIQAAKRLGYYVITTGNNPTLIGHKYADEYICANYTDYDLLLDLVKKQDIYAVISNCNDLGMMAATYLNNELHLPGVYDTLETARILHEKDAFKAFVAKHGFLTPESHMFDDPTQAEEFLRVCEMPVIVKPIDACGGRGISKAYSLEEGAAAVQRAFRQSVAKRILIEQFVEGRQYDLHVILQNKKVIVSYASDEFTFKNPYRVSCLALPADSELAMKEHVIGEIERMAAILDLKDGPLWLQYRVNNGKAYIIESARRAGGNNMIDLVSNGYGRDFGEYLVRLETGMPYQDFLDGVKLRKPQAYQSFMAPEDGVIEGVYISEELRRHIYKEYYWYQPGQVVTDHLHDEMGVVLMEYDTVDEMRQAISTINDEAKVIMK